MDPLFQLLKRLSDFGVEYILIGDMAAIVHGSTVVTRDVDVCAPPVFPNLQRIVAACGTWCHVFGCTPIAHRLMRTPPVLWVSTI